MPIQKGHVVMSQKHMRVADAGLWFVCFFNPSIPLCWLTATYHITRWSNQVITVARTNNWRGGGEAEQIGRDGERSIVVFNRDRGDGRAGISRQGVCKGHGQSQLEGQSYDRGGGRFASTGKLERTFTYGPIIECQRPRDSTAK